MNAPPTLDRTARNLHYGALGTYASLLVLIWLWEGWLAPSAHPSPGFWLVVKTVPLLLPARGLLLGRPRTTVLATLVVLLYFIEGIVLAYSSPAGLVHPVKILASLEVLFSTGFIILAGQYVRRAFRRA